MSPATTAPTLWNYDVCGRHSGAVPEGFDVLLLCVEGLPARRYLVLQVEIANDVLNFCEIDVVVRRTLIFPFLQRVAVLALQVASASYSNSVCLSICLSVRPSVRLSHAGNVSKRWPTLSVPQL